jgi:hypothetical protein
MKSPSSMRIRRFHPPKYRSKVQKMGVLYTHSPKMPGPFPKLLHNTKKRIFFNFKIRKKGGRHGEQPAVCQTTDRSWRATTRCRTAVVVQPAVGNRWSSGHD